MAGRAASPVGMKRRVRGRVKGAAPRAQPSLRGRSGEGGQLRSEGRAVPRRDDGARPRVRADRGRAAGSPPATVYSSQPAGEGRLRPPGASAPPSEVAPEQVRPIELLVRRSVGRIAASTHSAPGAPSELHPASVGGVAALVPIGFVPVYAERLRQPPRGRVPPMRHATTKSSSRANASESACNYAPDSLAGVTASRSGAAFTTAARSERLRRR
jgi:hypothetical protein